MTLEDTVTRRRFIAGSAAFAAMFRLHNAWANPLPASGDICRLMPEQEVGPFYLADELLRADIREGKAGIPLELRIALIDARTCRPLTGAAVDVWHCDALGAYSGFTNENAGGPGRGGPPVGDRSQSLPPPEMHPTDTLTFLRGIQITDDDGAVTFQTVFPGCYQGRTNHIHFKVRLDGETARNTYKAGHTSHTGQVFFPEEIAVRLMTREPYTAHRIRRTAQNEDGVFRGEHGDSSIARFEFVQPSDISVGCRAYLVAAVDPMSTPAPVGPGR